MTFSFTLTCFLLTTLVSHVSAHGFVHQLIIDGTPYIGNAPSAPLNPSILRQVSDIGPVKGTSNPDLSCGLSATLASQVANANPGSTVQWDWRGNSLAHWPHTTGPMMTYMASCGSTTCDQFNPSGAQWFLIDRVGQYSNGSWALGNVAQGALATVQIPSNLAPGNYLMRHEIISLQLAVSIGGAEFYPACAQLHIGGSQTGTPQSSDLVSLPGAYKDTDPGIYDPNVYNPGTTYTFPGPPIASFIAGSSGSGSGAGSGSGTTGGSGSTGNPGSTGSTGNSTSSGSSPGPSGTCYLRRNPNATSSDTSGSSGYRKRALAFHRRPRTLSRVMRDVFFGQEGESQTLH
ncbi:glycoside hydrolase family 61 protein [Amanita muscaria]